MIMSMRLAAVTLVGCLLAVGAFAPADAATITNPWSGTAGDRANYSAFAFRVTAGNYPNSVDPLGALNEVQVVGLDSLTFTRPANDTTQTPILGIANGQLSSVTAPVFVDVYTSRDGILAYSGYLGSSTNSVIFNDGIDPISPGESFTFYFSGLLIDKDTTYWLVFSEDAMEGEVSSFRTRVNTSGSDGATGPGRGYLVGNTAQVEYPGAVQDWGVEFIAVVNANPGDSATVTITAGTPAGEPATPGSFTVTRTGGPPGDLEVSYLLSGTATAGVDYLTPSGSVTIPANQTQASFTITPIDDPEIEDTETITATLTPRSYLVGTPDTATIQLTSDDTPATVTVQASDAAAGEVAGNPGSFVVTRTGPTLFSLTITYAMSGDATNAADYAYLNGTLAIPAGEASVTIPVTPFEDGTTEGTETVILTLNPSNAPIAQYAVGPQGSATVTIADDGSWNHWTESLPLVFGGYTGSEALTDFPVLVVLTPDRAGNYAGFSANGTDIRFRFGDLSLPYEIESWDPAGASFIWVRVPLITSGSDSMTLVWNNPTAIAAQSLNLLWSGDYIGVWHLNGPGNDGRYRDSTLRGNDASPMSALATPDLPDPVPARIGNGVSFAASQQNYLDTGNRENLGDGISSSGFTVAAWTRSPAAPISLQASGVVHRESNYQINWNHAQAAFQGAFALNCQGGVQGAAWYSSSLEPLEADTWYYLVGTYDGETLKSYRDGVLVSLNEGPSGPPIAETSSLKFGRHAAAAQYFTGVVDEVQILAAARSADWIANQYATMVDDFILYGGSAARVQIVASQSNAAEPATHGEFRITRSGGSMNLPLTIDYKVSGTATAGSDYTALSGTLTLAAGQSEATLAVNVIRDWLPLEGSETVVVTLTDRVSYAITGAPDATVTIADAAEDAIGNWQSKRRIGFGGFRGNTPLQDFPVLVTLTASATNDYAGFAANGADIRFSDAAMTTALGFEIEKWDPTGTSLIWVRVPQVSSVGDYIWMYWNYPGAAAAQMAPSTWSSSYLGVYHFADPVAITDSTTHGRNGTDTNTTSVPDEVDPVGAVGLGRRFDGISAFIDLGSPFLSNLHEFTLSGWIYPKNLETRMGLFGQNDAIEFGFITGTTTPFDLTGYTLAAASVAAPYTPALNEWHYVHLVGNPGVPGAYPAVPGPQLFIDGALVATGGDAPVDEIANKPGYYGASSYTVKIGGGGVWDTSGNWFNGIMDEIRLANVARSPDWIANEYATMVGTLTRCGTPIVDGDQDGDVDQVDFSMLQLCFGAVSGQWPRAECACFDTDSDLAITSQDVNDFVKCASGPYVEANPDCLSLP
ncbi:MAG TPA: DUF2341 domain-containing protein [Phycisphaerae bacterium]|nr:DUF2341 domain-containing protein [Phycisphaerae bacterium]HRY66830.1 DUF2341 domain-containing protein [Phycisphaerae bacterium]HSA26888.1 DUF2341 domain-containing protein [Phycisphaerae bacterium]